MRQYLRRFWGGGSLLGAGDEWHNTVGRFMSTFRVSVWNKSYCELDRGNPNGEGWTAYIPEGSAMPWTTVLFGYSFSTDQFTVKYGEIHYGKAIVESAEQTVTIAANNTYVGARMAWSSPSSVAIVKGNGSVDTTRPANDDTYFWPWLYKVSFADGVIGGIASYGHVGGAILIPGNFSQ